ncbi:MAG TPA: glycosyltransferase [Solirubrobacteraceae bacterium]|nr:glycosyltransferase [Solirubrobacteraceae bacterium]
MVDPLTPTPRVTVITPAHNASATLAEAVGSALAQTVSDLEVIVVDDGSAEPAAHVLRELNDPRLRVIRTAANRGVSAARNTAVATARAPVLAQLDADDLWRPDHLEGLLPALSDPAVGLAYSNAEIIGTPLLDRAISVRRPGDGLPEWVSERAFHPVDDLVRLYRVNPIPSPAAIMRTRAVRAVGAYPRWLTVGEDYYLYIKLRRAGWHFAYVDRMSAVYRWPERGRGVSFDTRRSARQTLKLFVVLTVRSPGTRELWARLLAEIANLIETHVPGSVPVGRRLKRLRGGTRSGRRGRTA